MTLSSGLRYEFMLAVLDLSVKPVVAVVEFSLWQLWNFRCGSCGVFVVTVLTIPMLPIANGAAAIGEMD